MPITARERDAHNAEMTEIPTSKAYYVGMHPSEFQAGTPAEILGVKVLTGVYPSSTPMPCFHLRYPDGREDYAPIANEDHVGKAGLGVLYEILSEEQMKAGKIPRVAN